MEKNKRILIIVENLPVPLDRRVWQEATTLKNKGYQVSVICPKMKGYNVGYEQIDGIDIYRHPLPLEANGKLGFILEYLSALLWQTLLAWKVFFTRGFDVIQACNPPDLIVFVAAPFKLFGRKFIFDHHDLNPELFEQKFKRKGLLYKLICWSEKATFYFADISIATNHSYRNIAIERGGMLPENVFVVRSGPDLTKLKRVQPQRDYRNSRRFIAGYLGIMGAQDGIDDLLEVVRITVKDLGRDDIQFLLIGDGPEKADMEAHARRMGLKDYITFTGFLGGEDLIDALNAIDIGIAPDEKNSYNDKCTMNKIMEYMALEKPVLQFDLTEGRYSAGDAAVYVEPANLVEMAEKLCQMMDDPEGRKAMGKIGRERMETTFGWNYEVPHLLGAYARVFDRNQPGFDPGTSAHGS